MKKRMMPLLTLQAAPLGVALSRNNGSRVAVVVSSSLSRRRACWQMSHTLPSRGRIHKSCISRRVAAVWFPPSLPTKTTPSPLESDKMFETSAACQRLRSRSPSRLRGHECLSSRQDADQLMDEPLEVEEVNVLCVLPLQLCVHFPHLFENVCYSILGDVGNVISIAPFGPLRGPLLPGRSASCTG